MLTILDYQTCIISFWWFYLIKMGCYKNTIQFHQLSTIHKAYWSRSYSTK